MDRIPGPEARHGLLDIDGGAAGIVAETYVNGAWELTLAGDGDQIRLEGVIDRNGDGHIIDRLLVAQAHLMGLSPCRTLRHATLAARNTAMPKETGP